MEEVIAKYRYAKSSPQKLRLVANQIRGLSVNKALNILNFSNKKAAVLLKKTLNSAIANAEHNNGLDIETLKISRIFVDEGKYMKKIMPRAKGRADRILKKKSHIFIAVSSHGEMV